MALNATLMALNATMRAVVYQGIPNHVAVVNLPIPTIEAQTDAVIRITTAGICGSDLHYYHGTYSHGSVPPWQMGHEAVGFVTDIGSGVESVEVGDRVVIPDVVGDEHLHMASQTGYASAFGTGADLGGCQAEYVRIPYADENLLVIPTVNETSNSTLGDDLDWLMLSDIFNTGWMGLNYAGFELGDSVAVFGAGPVGLLAAYSATLRGASRVYSVDHVESRLQLAASIGAIPINYLDSDPVDQILAYESSGVRRSIDCVGYEAYNANGEMQENIVLNNMIRVTARGGGLGGIGVWPNIGTNSSGAPLAGTINTTMSIDMGSFWQKALSLTSGGVDVTILTPMLSELIATGQAHPGFVVTAAVGIEDAPEAYARFSRHEEQKIVIRFPWA